MNKKVTKAGKYMSLLLRHKPEAEHLDMDKYGYVKVKQLLTALDIKMSDLEEIVESNNKKRFSFSSDKRKIRANQGHSIDVDLGLEPIIPPKILYHGTATKFLDSIYDKGIVKGERQHVHLSTDIETAKSVGKRHGTIVILEIDAKQMNENGIDFYLSENGVWLTDYIDEVYIIDEIYNV